jgi:hypothetical protein
MLEVHTRIIMFINVLSGLSTANKLFCVCIVCLLNA